MLVLDFEKTIFLEIQDFLSEFCENITFYFIYIFLLFVFFFIIFANYSVRKL
jgi:hypothetical protein